MLLGVASLVPLTAAQASAASVSSVTAALSSSSVSATGVTLTVTMVTSAALASGTEVAVMLNGSPTAFDFSNVSNSNITSSTMSGTGSKIVQGSTTYFNFTLSSAAAAGSHVITIANITNPSTSATGAVLLSTNGIGGFSSGAYSSTSVTVGEGGGSGGSNNGENEGGSEESGSSITGDNAVNITVQDEAGTALASENVFAFCGMSYSSGQTAADGTATISELTDGNCGVWMSSSTYYADTVYFTFLSDGTAKTEAVTLTASALDTNVQVTVTNPDGSAAASIYVYMTDTTGHEFYGGTNSSGQVTLGVVYGTYTLNGYVGSDSSSYYVPETTFTVDSSGLTSDGKTNTISVQLQEYTSFISGTVTSAASGLALSSPRMLAFSDAGMRFLEGNEDGTYEMGVVPGTYTIKAESTGYANGSTKGVVVAEGQTVSGKDFALADADNTLNLTTVDSDGASLALNGYVFCKDPDDAFDPASVYFSRLTDGSGSFNLPDGDFQCNAYVTGYVTTPPTFTLADGETEAGEIVLTAYNATLTVNLKDQDGNSLSNQRFGVFGKSADGYTLSGYSMGGGTSIGAIAGTYTLRVYVMGGGYTADYSKPTEVTLADGDTQSVTMKVYETDATIGGTVTDADDNVVADAVVKANCTTSADKTFEFTNTTDNSGTYSMGVVAGQCVLNAASADSAMLPSGEETVTVASGDSIDHDLQLHASNATLEVTPIKPQASGLSVTAVAVSTGSCYAYNDSGVYVTADIDADSNTATVPVTAGEWSYGCRVVTSGDVERVTQTDGTVTVDKNKTEEVNAAVGLVDDSYTDLIFQFSATSDSTITLPDGIQIFVPANALDTSGNVTVIASMATAVTNEDGLASGPAIALKARDSNNRLITGEFNADITIIFPYTKKLLTKFGLSEATITGGYTYNGGALAATDQGYTIDTENNTVTVTTKHFSVFTLVGEKAAAPGIPKALQAKHRTTASALLTWQEPVKGTVTKYQVQVRTTGLKSAKKWLNYKNVPKTQKLVDALKTQTAYQFRVAACDVTLCSAYSRWQTFRTK